MARRKKKELPLGAEKLELPGLPNAYKVTDSLFRGAQPTEEGLDALRALGVKTIVNLRAYHCDSKLAVRDKGFEYVHIRFKTWRPEEEHISRFLEVIADPARQPAFVHCQHGADRTGMMVAMYRMVAQGWDKESAVEEMITGPYGYHKRLWRRLTKFVENYDIENLTSRFEGMENKAAARWCQDVPRILVLSASVGAGHLRAAEAVTLALRKMAPEAEIRNVDVLSLTNRAFKKLYGEVYLDLVNQAPHILGYVYDALDRVPKSKNPWRDKIRKALDRVNLRALTHLLVDEPWDCFVNTHFLPAEIIAGLKDKGILNVPQLTVTTDFQTHRMWVNDPCEGYFTATEEGAEYLSSFGIKRKKITATGIPIHPAFSELPSRKKCLEDHGLKGDRPIILQMSGGFGVGPVAQILESILELEEPVEVIVAVGRNEDLANELQEVKVPKRHHVKIQGFTKRIHELMRLADLVVSKPGGLTTSEVLACGAAMVVVNPIPGQEAQNSDFLLEEGAAIKVSNLATLGYKLQRLFSDEKRFKRLKANAKALGRPKAAFDVAQRALDLAKKK